MEHPKKKLALLVKSLGAGGLGALRGAARGLRGSGAARQRRRVDELDSRPADPRRRAGERAAAAALAMGALAWLAGLAPGPPQPPACPHPQELQAREGWTTAVLCGSSDSARGPLRGPVTLLFGEAMDLNEADARSLEALPAIGPKRAAAIVSTRAQRRFSSLDDLERVPGIGPGIAGDLRIWVKVSDRSGPSEDR